MLKTSLFKTKKEFLFFVFTCSFVFGLNLFSEYKNYKQLLTAKTLYATVQKAYIKTKNKKTYKVLKLQTDKNFTFYTVANKNLKVGFDDKVRLKIWTKKLTFYEYLSGGFLFSKTLHVEKKQTNRQKLNQLIASQHKDKNTTLIYQALFSATPLTKELQTTFSNLGISHLLAISGFHLGVLATVLFFAFKPFYNFFHKKFFPFRSYKIDSFLFVSVVLFFYLSFLNYPPSVLRAYAMLVVGFFLYQRWVKVITMQTLFVTVFILLAFFPRLFFSIGFWLSVGGVFFIFLFLNYFKHLKQTIQFFLLPIYVYISMLPFSLYLFHNFSDFHIFSILESMVFTLFYPLSIVLHLLNLGYVFDEALQKLITLGQNHTYIPFQKEFIYSYILLCFGAVFNKKFFWLSLLFGCLVLCYSLVQNVTQF